MRITEHPILEFQRGEDVTFFFDGQELKGYVGETIAAALHAEGIRVLGHSQTMHRPRGLFCAIGNCSSCLMVSTFEDKAEALHYYPMFRTWFGLNGLCKLPWNDVAPADNKFTDEPAKIPEHVQNYVDIFNAVTGKTIDKHELIRQSERVYNFQRIFNIRMGYGKRVHDRLPYRAMGPVTVEEYLSRQERYDKQLVEFLGYDTEGKSTEEKMQAMRDYRENQYEKLTDAVYKRRGWTMDGVPTVEKLRELGMDLPDVLEIVKKHV